MDSNDWNSGWNCFLSGFPEFIAGMLLGLGLMLLLSVWLIHRRESQSKANHIAAVTSGVLGLIASGYGVFILISDTAQEAGCLSTWQYISAVGEGFLFVAAPFAVILLIVMTIVRHRVAKVTARKPKAKKA